MNKKEMIKSLSLEETAIMNRLKESYFIDSVHYKDEYSERYFKLLCHLEDFVIQYHELNQRIEKAIEYINEHRDFSYDENCEILDGVDIEKVLEILKGDNIE